ncbi:MAG: sterol desaturase family protein [Chitinophagales bacterium]
MIYKFIALLVGFLGMELVAHLMHKYVMHGFLWSLHESHHQKGRGFWEKNDIYFLIFATPGIALIIYGTTHQFSWPFFLGLGISLYGFTYLLIHDIIIHQRFKMLSKIDNGYIKALKRAHKAHHANVHKDAAVSYGMLWIDKKYYKPTDLTHQFKEHNLVF